MQTCVDAWKSKQDRIPGYYPIGIQWIDNTIKSLSSHDIVAHIHAEHWVSWVGCKTSVIPVIPVTVFVLQKGNEQNNTDQAYTWMG